MAGNDAEPSPITSKEDPQENHSSITSKTFQHIDTEVAQETCFAPIAAKCSEFPQGGILKNGNTPQKAKNFKAGFKINQLADKLAKRSLKVLEVVDSAQEPVSIFPPIAAIASDPSPPCLSLRSEDISLTAATPLPPLSSTASINFQNPSLPTKAAEDLSNIPLNVLPTEVSDSQVDNVVIEVEEKPPDPPDEIISTSVKNIDADVISVEVASEFSDEKSCEDIPASPSIESEKPADVSTAFNDTENSTKERVKKRSSPRCKKEVDSVQTDSVVRRGKTKIPNKQNRKLVEMSTQTAEIQFLSAVKEEPLPLPTIDAPTFICLFCQLTFRDKTDCLNHEATHSLKRKTKFIKCQFCSKKLPNLEEFKSHSTKFHRPNFHLCTECDLRFLNNESLVLHTQLDHFKIDTADKTQFSILNKKVRLNTSLDIDVSFDTTQKKPSISPRCSQKPSPKDKTEEYEAEMLFYSYLSGNIKENLSNHLDGKIDQFDNNLDISEISKNTSLLTVAPNTNGPSAIPITRAPSPYQTRSKTPNPLPSSAKKFKKLPNWQQKFWEKYNFPTNYRFEHRFWDKNYINTEKSALYLKDLSCLDIKTQLTMRENVKKLDPKVAKDDAETFKNSFPYMIDLIPQGRPVAVEATVVAKEDLSKIPKKKVVKEGKIRRVRPADGLSNQVVTRQQKGIEGGRERKGSLDLGADKKAILRRQTSLDNIGSPNKEKDLQNLSQDDNEISEAVLENSIMSGEWVRPRSYLCGTCCTKFASLWELEDHKWLTHPNVYCTHYEFENDKVDNLFQLEAESPQVARITLPDLYRRNLHPQGSLQQAEPSLQLSFPQSCSKCQKLSANQSDLHKHILDCGGDTTWSLTMTASPATNKRRWRPYGSRRRKPSGQRSVKRNIPSTPNQKSTGLHPKIRTKPGDVESIQKMLANLPEKRTRRAINFDSVSTRSQTTIHSHRYLRKRMTAQFNRNFLRRKVLSNVRSKQLKVSVNRIENEIPSTTANQSKSVNLENSASRRRYRLKDVTVNVTPLTLSPEMLKVSLTSSSGSAKTEVKKNNPKKEKVVTALKKEIKSEPAVEPEVEKKILGKIAKRKGYLVKKIKQKLIKSKKVMENRRRSERIKVKDDPSEKPVKEKKKKKKKLTGSLPKPPKKRTVKTDVAVLDFVATSATVTDLKAPLDDITDEEVPIAKLVVQKKEVIKPADVDANTPKIKAAKQKVIRKKPVGTAEKPVKKIRKTTKKEPTSQITPEQVPLDVLEESAEINTTLKPVTLEKPVRRVTRKISDVVENAEMPVLNKEEPIKKRQLRKSDDFPILKPAEDTDDVKIEKELPSESIVGKVIFKVVKKNGKSTSSKTKITPLKIIKENKNIKKNLSMDSGSDSEPLIALKQTKQAIVVKKINSRIKVKRNVKRNIIANIIENKSDESKDTKKEILSDFNADNVKLETKTVHNLMIEKMINDKLNERLAKHKKAIHKRTKLKPSLKQLRMTVTLKEATLKVIDKQAPVSLPNKWTVSTPTNNLISFNSAPTCLSTDLINPIIINSKSPEIEIIKESNLNIVEPIENIPINKIPFVEVSESNRNEPIALEANKSDEQIEVISNENECDISTTSIEINTASVSKIKEVIPILTIEEATSSEDAKPSRSAPVCNVKISEADSSVGKIVSTESGSLYDFKIEEEVSSTKPNLKVVKKRKRDKVVEDLDGKEESPTSTLNVPEQLDRRSRRRSKEVPTTSEFVIDEPLLLVDELWSDLDSDTDSKQRKKIKKVKKKTPKKKILPEKPVDLEAILRNFGETKEIEDDIICLPMRKERTNPITDREQIVHKVVIDENLRTRLALRLFSYRKTILRYGREGGKLSKSKKKVFDSIQLSKAPVLSSEITENPEQVIVCRSIKPKAIKKSLDPMESKPLHQRLRISLPLEILGDLPVLNNNHLEAPTPTPDNPDCCARPPSPEIKPVVEAKPKRSEVIDKIFYCEICKTYYYSPSQLKNHKMSNRHKMKCEELGLTAGVNKESEKSNTVTSPQEEEKEDTSEMPVLEGPFIETKVEAKPDVATSSGQTSVFGFSEESLKDIQKAIGCTDEEMLILTLLGENTVPEPDILDISNFTSKPETEKVLPIKTQTKSNGAIKIDLKQRMTNALSSLVNRAVNNFLNKSELIPLKVSDKSDAATFLNKLSGLSNRRTSFTQNDLALVLESIPHSSDLSEIRYKYQCSMCSNRFEKESTRDYHMTRKHRVGKRSKAAYKEVSPPPEDWNDSSWYDCEDLNTNQSSQFWCSECGINFLSPKEVLEHQKTEHPPESSRTTASEYGDDVKPTMKRTITLDPDQEKLLATEALQKLVGHRQPRNSKGRKSQSGINKVKKSDSFNDLKLSNLSQSIPSTSPPKVPFLVPDVKQIEVPIMIETEKNVTDIDVTDKTLKNVDIYDFNEFDSDPEPVVLAHVRKSGTTSQDKASESEKDDDDSEDNIPLSSVKIPKPNDIFAFSPRPESNTITIDDTKTPETNRFRESLKISLENKFLRLDENSLIKSSSSSSLSDGNSMNIITSNKSDHCDESDNQPIENVVYHRNESMTSFESAFDDTVANQSALSSFSDSDDDDRPPKKIIPLLSATLPNRKSESPKLNKEVIVKKIWNRQKLKLNQDSPTSDVAKGTIMKKVWRKKKLESEEQEVINYDDVKINQTEISDEVVIKCGPKPKNINRRRSMNETAKDAIVRRIWSGKCGFQTKAALKTYDSDVFPTEISTRNEVPVNSSSNPAKRRGRPSSVSAIKRRKVSSASEDDLDSLLEEIEQENVEKAIRSEFLHLRRCEKNPIDSSKESAGLFAEIQPVDNSPEKKKRKIRKNVKILKRKFDSNEFRNRRHKKHKHHHHKHKHKKSRHHKKVVHRNKHKSAISGTKSSNNDISQFNVLDRISETSVTNSISDTEKFKEPRISSDLDNLDLKLNAILSPYDSTNKLNGDISDDEISFTDKNIYKT